MCCAFYAICYLLEWVKPHRLANCQMNARLAGIRLCKCNYVIAFPLFPSISIIVLIWSLRLSVRRFWYWRLGVRLFLVCAS